VARKPAFPVTVRQLPVVRCALCGRTLAHQPGAASTVLTAHYRNEHPDVLSPDAGED
jgi:hypothetical protein